MDIEIIRAAIGECFKAKIPANVANIRARTPADFWGQLTDAEVGQQIQAAFSKPADKPDEPPPQVERILIADTPDGRPFPAHLPPSEHIIEQTQVAEPVAERTAEHVQSGPGPTPEERLHAGRQREANLIASRPALNNALREASGKLAAAIRAMQIDDPNRETPEMLSASFRKASAEQRAARARGEKWATPPERRAGGKVAFVDLERQYSQGGDGNTFARSQNTTGNRRGAYSKQSLGRINTDPKRGAVPKPVEQPRPTVPMLAK